MPLPDLVSQIQGRGVERIHTSETKIHRAKTEKTLTAVALYASTGDDRAQRTAKDVRLCAVSPECSSQTFPYSATVRALSHRWASSSASWDRPIPCSRECSGLKCSRLNTRIMMSMSCIINEKREHYFSLPLSPRHKTVLVLFHVSFISGLWTHLPGKILSVT